MESTATSSESTQDVKSMTAAEFFLLRNQFEHCELIDGEVTTMTPTGRAHGRVEARLGRLLDEYLEKQGDGEVVVGEVGYLLRQDLVRAADIAVHLTVPETRPGFETTLPDLVVEIVSPNDRWADVERKVSEYLVSGVREIWIADPDQRLIMLRRPDGTSATFRIKDVLKSSLLPGFEAPLARIFP